MQLKKITFLLLSLSLTTMKVTAQVNPQKGYIITNENDTIYGTIDYLTDEKNAKVCLFQKEGECGYKSLSPKDIKGYRLADDGIYYVSRLFTGGEENVQEQLFAEFLLQGGVSLYRYYYERDNYFGFEGNNGKEVIIRDDKLDSDLRTYDFKLQKRRQVVQEVNAVMNQDNTIANRLWKMDLTSENLTKLVKRYDEQYCTEQGECVLFRYDKKKTIAVTHRFYVGAGISYSSYGSPEYDKFAGFTEIYYDEYKYTGVAPTFFVGADFQFPRFSRNLNAQVELGFTPHRYESSQESSEGVKPRLILNELSGRIGMSYVFCPNNRIKPFINGGFLLSWNMTIKEENVFFYNPIVGGTADKGICNVDHGRGAICGIYLGAGVDINHIRISASWKKGLGGSKGLKHNGEGLLSVAYLF